MRNQRLCEFVNENSLKRGLDTNDKEGTKPWNGKSKSYFVERSMLMGGMLMRGSTVYSIFFVSFEYS